MREKFITDTRVHCCLFFINPTGHSLKPVRFARRAFCAKRRDLDSAPFSLPSQIDITVMKKLSEVVNVVPVIAKSDSLTLEEREAFKSRVSLSWRSLQPCYLRLTTALSPLIDPRRAHAPLDPTLPLRHDRARRRGARAQRPHSRDDSVCRRR